MKTLIEKIKETVPTLVVFRHKGEKGEEETMEMIENLQSKFGSQVNIVSIDASHNGEYKSHYKLTTYPAYILFKEGQELMRESGVKTEAQLEEMITRAL